MAMPMMLDGEIDATEYRAIKSRYEQANTTLLKERASLEINKIDYASKIDQ